MADNEEKKDTYDLGLLKWLNDLKELELQDVDLVVEHLEFLLQPQFIPQQVPRAVAPAAKPTKILTSQFVPPVESYRSQIVEVVLGATKSQGGTRNRQITIGGEKTPPFYIFEDEKPHPPVTVGDVFDMKIHLSPPVREHFGDVVEDPAEWARRYVEKFDVDMIDLELISTDPLINDTPATESAKLIEEVLQAVDVPLIIGGSGNPKKDIEILTKAAEVAEGENILLSSATPDLYEPIAEAAKKYDHCILAWTSLDINQQKELNRKILEYVPKERIVIDPTSAALGYGIEYAFTIMERMRLAGLWGDEELMMPMAAATSNSWAAREAWRKAPELGPRKLRGPLWETTSTLVFLLAGVDMFIMLHPAAIKTVKDVAGWLMRQSTTKTVPKDWVGLEVA